jgi:hypothetical protein
MHVIGHRIRSACFDRHWSPSIIMAGFGMPQPPINPANPNNDSIVPNPPADSISSLTFSPNSSLLVAGSWDNKLSCYQVSQNMGQLAAVPVAQAQHDGPVLSTAFSADSAHVFSGGCDKVRARFSKMTRSFKTGFAKGENEPLIRIHPPREYRNTQTRDDRAPGGGAAPADGSNVDARPGARRNRRSVVFFVVRRRHERPQRGGSSDR